MSKALTPLVHWGCFTKSPNQPIYMGPEKEVLITLIAGTVVILFLLGFAIWALIYASKAFRRGIKWAEAQQYNYSESEVKQILLDHTLTLGGIRTTTKAYDELPPESKAQWDAFFAPYKKVGKGMDKADGS